MQIGNTIRKYRKEKGMTQEKINTLLLEADGLFKTMDYADVFQWIKAKLELYPNCLPLIWQFSSLLDAQRLFKPVPDADHYDTFILTCYHRVLESEDETLRTQAADSLFSYYLRKEEYHTAEQYLSYFSLQNPQRKLKQAIIYQKTGRLADAYRTSEELLFSGYQILNMTLQNLYLLSMEESDLKKAHFFTDKQQALAKVFEMGKYHEVSCKLELATVEKDADTVLDIMEAMLDSIDQIANYTASALYEHMNLKQTSPTFFKDLKNNLLCCFRDESTYGFLKSEERWENLAQSTPQ